MLAIGFEPKPLRFARGPSFRHRRGRTSKRCERSQSAAVAAATTTTEATAACTRADGVRARAERTARQLRHANANWARTSREVSEANCLKINEPTRAGNHQFDAWARWKAFCLACGSAGAAALVSQVRGGCHHERGDGATRASGPARRLVAANISRSRSVSSRAGKRARARTALDLAE